MQMYVDMKTVLLIYTCNSVAVAKVNVKEKDMKRLNDEGVR